MPHKAEYADLKKIESRKIIPDRQQCVGFRKSQKVLNRSTLPNFFITETVPQ